MVPEIEAGNSRVLTAKRLIEVIDILFNLILHDVIDQIQKSVSLKYAKYGIPHMTWSEGPKACLFVLGKLLTYASAELYLSDGHTGWKLVTWDFVSTIVLLRDDSLLGQSKKRQRGVFVKAKKSRSAKAARLNLRIPHH